MPVTFLQLAQAEVPSLSTPEAKSLVEDLLAMQRAAHSPVGGWRLEDLQEAGPRVAGEALEAGQPVGADEQVHAQDAGRVPLI